MTADPTVGFWLRRLRRLRDLTQRDLSIAMGYPPYPTMVSRWEKGRQDMRAADLRKAAEVLGCEPGDFFADVSDARFE